MRTLINSLISLILSALLACGQGVMFFGSNVPQSVALTISFDAVSESGYTPSGGATWSHTCTGSSLTLVVFVWSRTTATVTGVTYNGVAMVAVSGATVTSTNQYIYTFILTGPATGTHSVVVTATAETWGFASSYKGTAAAGQPDNSTTTSGTLTAAGFTAPASLTVNTTGSWIVGEFQDNAPSGLGSYAWTAGTHALRLKENNTNTAITDSNAIVSTGSQTYNGSADGGNAAGTYVAALISLKPGP